MTEIPNGKPEVPGIRGLVNEAIEAEVLNRVVEARTFKGPMAEQIGKWQKEGLGRVIGVPLTGIPKIPGVPEHPYQAMMYVLPLPEVNASENNQRAWAIFPNEKGCNYALLRPRRADARKSKEEQRIENAAAQENFEKYYLSSGDPVILTTPAWNPLPGEMPFSTFSRNTADYPMYVEQYITEDANIAKYTNDALKQARINNAKKLKVDDTVLENLIPTDVAAELAVISSDWEAQQNLQQKHNDLVADLDRELLQDYDWVIPSIVDELAESGEIFSAEDHSLSPEELGFQGPMAEKIAKWKQEGGLGKEVVIPVPSTKNGEPQQYRSVMYALPLDGEKGLDRRFLLIFPTKDSFDFKVVSPQASTNQEEDMKIRENDNNILDFHLLFGHVDVAKPTILTGWEPDPEIPLATSFVNVCNAGLYPVDIKVTDGADSDQIVKQAEANARLQKVKRMGVDEHTLLGQLAIDSDLIGEFGVADAEWDRRMWEELGNGFIDPGFPDAA